MSRRLVALAVIATALALGGCGGDGEKSASNAAGAGSTDKTVQVAIDTFQFMPKRLEIVGGTTVTWTNKDEILHTATGPGFDGQMDGKGTTFTFTFDEAGTFSYRCTRHPGMDATVVVS